MTPEIRTAHIDLWLTFPDDIRNMQLLDRYRQQLSDKEQAQERRFHFSKDQHRYLITRALVRTVLSRYAPVAPEQWSFTLNPYGKPVIANDDCTARKISFNISHTDGLIVMGVTSEKSLGVDIENIRARHAPIEVARDFFSADEVAALCALPPALQHDRFFQYWTLKEAYIKARGMGLSIPLDQFSFDFRDGVYADISFDSRLDDHPSRWHFSQLRLFSDYMLAVCVERTGNAPPHLHIRKIIP